MMNTILEAGATALSVFGTRSQNNRLMRMTFPHGDGPPNAATLINTVRMCEELSRDFRIEAEVLSDNAGIALKSMMGRMVTILLVREDGSVRYMNGYVTTFAFVRTDGGFAYYSMVLEPWLAFARLRKDNVSFHHRSVLELTESTFAHYRQHDWTARMSLDYEDRKLTCANQHNETDYNHLHRRWEDAGLYYWYEHREDGHTLILSDNSMQAEPIDIRRADGVNGLIYFRGQAGSNEADGIHEWQAIRNVGAGSMTLSSFDYESPRAERVTGYSLNEQGDVPDYERYENTGAYGFADVQEGEALAQRRMEEHDWKTQYFEVEGNDRTAQPGRTFKLAGHFSAIPKVALPGEEQQPGKGSRDYLIVSVVHTASNNYPAGVSGKSEYTNTFTCLRRNIRWRPGRGHNSKPCKNPGVQTAIVVGPPGEDVHTDELGRVKVQFHWDRLGEFDQASSPWIRVMMPMAGNYFGQMCLPRVGQEVVVQFLDGNVDRPIVVGVVYNRDNMPPWHLPAQRSLSGLRSREFGDPNGGSNHLILDDTSGRMQVQLKSDHQHSQLLLGSVCRIETSDGRLDARGEGWELATNAWGVARANRGMLVTTEPRQNAAGQVKAMSETVRRLNAAQQRQDDLAKLAKQCGAQMENEENKAASAIADQNSDIKGTDGNQSAFPELAAPHLVLASPAGIETTTAGSTHVASEHHTAVTTGQDISFAAGGSLFASVRQAIRMFVHKAGIRMIAAAGDIDVNALSNSINLLAKLNITQSAERITINAKEEVVINGGGSYAKFRAGAIEFGAAGSFTAHAATHSFEGAKTFEVNSVGFVSGSDPIINETDEAWVEFKLIDQDGPIPGERFVLTDPGGAQHYGNVNERGAARLEKLPAGRCKVEFPDLSYSIEVETI